VNLGVLMEDVGKTNDAFSLYSEARNIYPENISALLNQYAMLEKGYKMDRPDVIREEVKSLVSVDMSDRPDAWSLLRSYGYVRDPKIFVALGMLWVASGQPGVAVENMRKTIDFLADSDKSQGKQALADLYLSQNESEAVYSEILSEQPGNVPALLGMARFSIRKGNFKQASEYLGKAEKAGASRPLLLLEMASISLMESNVDQARLYAEEIVGLKENVAINNVSRVWLILVEIYRNRKDLAGLQHCIDRMNETKALPKYLVHVAAGHLSRLQNKLMDARHHFEMALRDRPDFTSILEYLLRLDLLQGRMSDADDHAAKLLKIDSGNALANYAVGSMQMFKKEYILAEDSLRKSIERRASPEAMNDLAWLLYVRGDYDEAEKLARGSVKQNSKLSDSWDTLGCILVKKGMLDEAEKVFETSIALASDNLGAVLHMAQLQAQKGNKAKAMEFLGELVPNQKQMSAENREEFEKLKKALDLR